MRCVGERRHGMISGMRCVALDAFANRGLMVERCRDRVCSGL